MKIEVRDDRGKPLGAIRIKVVDASEDEAAKQIDSVWHRFIGWLALKITQKKQSGSSKQRVKSKSPKSSDKPKTIEIKISLPHIPNRQEFVKTVRGASKRHWAIAAACLFILSIMFYALLLNNGKKPEPVTAATKSRPTLQRGTPKYKTILPAGKTIDQLGGWAKVSPPDRAPVYAYVDRIGAVQVRVSEQPLPAKFIGDPSSQVAQLAQDFNANEKFQAANTTAYVATYSNGTQYVILSTNNLLILINSSDSLSNDQWAAYINSLH